MVSFIVMGCGGSEIVNSKAKSSMQDTVFSKLREQPLELSENGKLKEGLVGIYKLPKSETLVVAESSDSAFTCHACGVKISFFVFDEKAKLKKSYMYALELGKYGSAPAQDDIKVVEIAKGVPAVMYSISDGGQGIDVDVRLIYRLAENGVEKIFDERVSVNNEASISSTRTDWKATLHFDKSKIPYHDIVLHKKGIEDSKLIDQRIVYKFDGEKYVSKHNKRQVMRAE